MLKIEGELTPEQRAILEANGIKTSEVTVRVKGRDWKAIKAVIESENSAVKQDLLFLVNARINTNAASVKSKKEAAEKAKKEAEEAAKLEAKAKGKK